MNVKMLSCVCAALMVVACSRPAKRVNVKAPGDVVVTTNNAQARTTFQKAVRLLESQQYQESIEVFKIVRAEYPDDPVAPASQLYMARATMGDVIVKPDASWVTTTKPDQIKYAINSLNVMAQDESLNIQIRYAASLYLAVAQTVAGKPQQALASLKGYPGGTISGLILKADRVAALHVLSTALTRQKRYKAALVAVAGLRATRESANIASKFVGNDTVMSYATSKAFELASVHVDTKSLHMEFIVSKDVLLQAAAGSSLIHRHAKETLDEARRKVIEDLFNRTSTALIKLGLTTRVAELSRVMVSIADNRKLVVGALLPLSGKSALIGRRIMRGLMLAQRAYTPQSQGARVTLVFEDSTKPPKDAFASLQKQGVLAVIGPVDKTRASAYTALAKTAKLPMIMLTAKSLAPQPTLKKEDAYVFRHFIHAEAEARLMANLSAKTYKNKRIVVLVPDIAYGALMQSTFEAALKAHGVSPLLVVKYDRKKNDYSRIARRVARARPDAIYIPDTSDKVSQMSAFLAKENIWGKGPTAKTPKRSKRQWVHYLGTSIWQDKRLIQQAATYVNGASIPTWYAAALNGKKARAFTTQYKTIFRSEPSIYEAFAYDAMMWLRDLMLTQGLRRPQALRDALIRPQGFDGVTGQATFHLWGEPDRKIHVLLARPSGFVPTNLSQRVLATPKAPKTPKPTTPAKTP